MGAEKRLKDAVEAAHAGKIDPLIEEAISDKVAEERRRIDLEFARKVGIYSSLELEEMPFKFNSRLFLIV